VMEMFPVPFELIVPLKAIVLLSNGRVELSTGVVLFISFGGLMAAFGGILGELLISELSAGAVLLEAAVMFEGNSVLLEGTVLFMSVLLVTIVRFMSVLLEGTVMFMSVLLEGAVMFISVLLEGDVMFMSVLFEGAVMFMSVLFEAAVMFDAGNKVNELFLNPANGINIPFGLTINHIPPTPCPLVIPGLVSPE